MNDFRYAFRTLRRSSGVAAVAITSLALGIGATTAIFSFTNAVILRSLPVQKPSELVLLRYASKKGNIFDEMGYQEYLTLRDAPEVLTGLAAVSSTKMNLASAEATERIPGQLVSGNYFPILGVRPRIGRLIAPEDDVVPGGHPVCVISYGLWQRRFGSASDIVGKKVEINGRPYTILGVTPAGFDGTDQGTRAQIYVPLMMAAQISSREADPKVQPPFRNWTSFLNFVGRRQPGVTRARAEAVLDSRFATLPLAKQDFTFEMSSRHTAPGPRARLLVEDGKQGFDNLRMGYERPLLFLMFLVALLLLIACANVASLLVARAAGQRKQIAIRLALGASRWALIRQQLAESALLAVGGAGRRFTAVDLDLRSLAAPGAGDQSDQRSSGFRRRGFPNRSRVSHGAAFRGCACAGFRKSRRGTGAQSRKHWRRPAARRVWPERWSSSRSRFPSRCWPAPDCCCVACITCNPSRWAFNRRMSRWPPSTPASITIRRSGRML